MSGDIKRKEINSVIRKIRKKRDRYLMLDIRENHV